MLHIYGHRRNKKNYRCLEVFVNGSFTVHVKLSNIYCIIYKMLIKNEIYYF